LQANRSKEVTASENTLLDEKDESKQELEREDLTNGTASLELRNEKTRELSDLVNGDAAGEEHNRCLDLLILELFYVMYSDSACNHIVNSLVASLGAFNEPRKLLLGQFL
jgi:hypothetical protein